VSKYLLRVSSKDDYSVSEVILFVTILEVRNITRNSLIVTVIICQNIYRGPPKFSNSANVRQEINLLQLRFLKIFLPSIENSNY
jgi:hypothetical protein